MAQNNADIAKVVSCENNFAALSSNGEVFTFTLNPVSGSSDAPPQSTKPGSNASVLVKPQRLWALRKQFSAVRDVALGAGGTVALCTESGHVYIRQRLGKGGTFKFTKMPGLQRVVKVAASGAGAFAALRAECLPTAIGLEESGVAKDVGRIRPWVIIPGSSVEEADTSSPAESSVASPGTERSAPLSVGPNSPVDDTDLAAEEDEAERAIASDIREIEKLLNILEQDSAHRFAEGNGLYDLEGASSEVPRHWKQGGGAHGADLRVRVGECFEFPAHSIVFAARSAILRGVLAGKGEEKVTRYGMSIAVKAGTVSNVSKGNGRRQVNSLAATGVHPLSMLLLATYLYTDNIPAIWDSRISSAISSRLRELVIPVQGKNKKLLPPSIGQVQTELQTLAKLLKLDALEVMLALPFKRACPPRAVRDWELVFDRAQEIGQSSSNSGMPADPLAPDVVIHLADYEVYAHSAILRSRSPFFVGFFDEPAWTERRWLEDGMIHLNMRHMQWRTVQYAAKWIYEGGGEELFQKLEFVQSVDEVLDFMFEVMDVAVSFR